jgi:hypothetical protein
MRFRTYAPVGIEAVQFPAFPNLVWQLVHAKSNRLLLFPGLSITLTVAFFDCGGVLDRLSIA